MSNLQQALEQFRVRGQHRDDLFPVVHPLFSVVRFATSTGTRPVASGKVCDGAAVWACLTRDAA